MHQTFPPCRSEDHHLNQTDIGRPFSDLKSSFPDVDLISLAAKVLRNLNTVEMEILSKDDIWYSVKVIPYRTAENVIDGVVMTVIDVHRVKQADKIRRLSNVLEDSNDALTVLDLEGNILA